MSWPVDGRCSPPPLFATAKRCSSISFCAVGVGEEAANLLGAVGDAAMHFADPEDGVFRARLAGGALDLTWRVQLDGDRAGNRAQGLAPADDTRDRLLVHAVLQRDDIAIGR